MSLVTDVKDIIYDEIRRRPYRTGEKLPGIRELAKDHGVSYVTMSNALGMLTQEGLIKQFPGKGSFVTEMASRNSLAFFVPDYLIGLRNANSATDSTCVFGLMDVYAGLLASVQREGFNLHVIPITGKEPNVKKKYELITKKLNVSGAFFMALPSDNLIEYFSKTKLPCCKLHTPEEAIYNYVAVDMEKGAFKLVEHLIKSNHERIAMISGGHIEDTWFKGRYSGYLKALKKYNIKSDPELIEVISGHATDDILKESIEKLLSTQKKPTAIFVTSDLWALRIMKILQAKGINIPEDISVAGFDDYVESKVSTPSLTTVAQPFYEIGERAFLVMKRLLLEPTEKVTYKIEPNLIIRKSTASLEKSRTNLKPKIKKTEMEACLVT